MLIHIKIMINRNLRKNLNNFVFRFQAYIYVYFRFSKLKISNMLFLSISKNIEIAINNHLGFSLFNE